MHPPLTRPLPSSFPFPWLNTNNNSSFFPKSPIFILSASSTIQTTPVSSPPQFTPSQPQPLNLDSHLINADGSSQTEQNLHPIQPEQRRLSLERNRRLHVQDLADRIKHGKLKTISEFSTLIDCYCKRNEPMEAKRILEHIIGNGFESPKVTTFTQVINSFSKKGRLKEAFEVFGIMGSVQCEPTINTYNCLLKGLCYVGRVEEACALLSKIKKSWVESGGEGKRLQHVTLHEPDIRTLKIKRSLKRLDGGIENVILHGKGRLKPDIYTYTAVMDGLCKVGRSDEAKDLLDEAIDMGLTPGTVTYNTLFNGYFKEGTPKKGFRLLRQMKDRNCFPDYIIYSTLLHGLLQWREITAGVRVYKEMEESGFEVDERMMNTLLRGLCRRSRKEKDLLQDAYQLFDKMSTRSCYIDPCAYELMIEAYCNGKDFDMAFVNLCDMIRMGLSIKAFTFDIVIRGLCIEGKLDKALVVLVSMFRKTSRMPGSAALNALFNEMNRQGMVTSTASIYCAALKRGWYQ